MGKSKRYKITLIPGDGVGPEIVNITRNIIDRLGVGIEWEEVEAGEIAIEKYGTPLPESVIESIQRNKVALKGPITTPIGSGFRSINVTLRKKFDLYACVRPCKVYPNTKSLYPNVDIVVIRENTEDLYSGVEFDIGTAEAKQIISLSNNAIPEDAAITIKFISRRGSERIVRFAFEYAKKCNRKKVTVVTKANIMKYTDGLFLQVARQIAPLYPEIVYEEMLIDNLCMQLVQKPHLYDVLVLPNLYGDIVSDLCAGIVGGLGMAPGANIGDEIAIFEPTHGSAPKYKGMNKVNPTATILSAKLMLEHLGEYEAAYSLEKAVIKTLQEGKKLTYDLGGGSTNIEFAEEILRNLELFL